MTYYIYISIGVISLIITYSYYLLCLKKKIYDIPTKISVHKKPIPKGVGLIIILFFSLILFFIDFLKLEFQEKFMEFFNLTSIWPLYLVIAFSSIFFFIDDLKNLNPLTKLSYQFFSAFVMLAAINFPFMNLPIKLEYLLSIVLLIYFANIFNFIDGYDGMFSLSVIFILIASNIVIFNDSNMEYIFIINTILIIILIPYSIFNKTNNLKIFLGDSGAVTIGFFLGWEMLTLIKGKYFIYVFIIYLYPCLDVTLTLIKKILNKKNLFSRDFDYFFLMPIKKYNKNHPYVFKQFALHYFSQAFLITFYSFINNYLFLVLAILNTIWLLYRLNKGLDFVPTWRK